MNSYIVVQDWMLDLGLPATEINALALIWGFTQDGQHACHASLQYIGRFCAIKEKASVSRMLKRMAEKGIITIGHTDGGVSEYKVSEVLSKSQQRCCRNNNGVLSQQQRGVVVTTTDNNIYNIVDNNNNPPISPQGEEVANADLFSDEKIPVGVIGADNISTPPLTKNKSKSKYEGEGFHFKQIPADPDEVKRFIGKYAPSLDWQEFYMQCERSGWRYGKNNRPIKDWKAEIFAWVRYRAKKQEM